MFASAGSTGSSSSSKNLLQWLQWLQESYVLSWKVNSVRLVCQDIADLLHSLLFRLLLLWGKEAIRCLSMAAKAIKVQVRVQSAVPPLNTTFGHCWI